MTARTTSGHRCGWTPGKSATQHRSAAGLAKSQASTVASAENVVAKAGSDLTGLAVGPLRLGQVLSTAEVKMYGLSRQALYRRMERLGIVLERRPRV